MPAADRQRQLLEVAMGAFSRRGFKGTTTKEIATAAGVAEAIIFQHFPSKEALYSTLLERHLDSGEEQRWDARITECMDRNDDASFFRLFIERIFQDHRRDPLLERVILFAALEGHEQGLARLHEMVFSRVERILAYIARRQAEGAFIKCSPHMILLALNAMARQYIMLTGIIRAPVPEMDEEELVQLFTRILQQGIRETAPKDTESSDRKPESESKRKAKE